MNRRLLPVFTWVLCLTTVAAQAAQEHEPVGFNQEIRLILSDNCYACHGPDKNTRKGGVRLDTEEGSRAERKGRSPVVPGHPEKSELLRRLESSDPDEQMPPPETGKILTAHQKELLRNWILQGGKFEPHWSFIPPVRAELPPASRPAWVKSPVDSFILSRLDKEGLIPSSQADRRTLLRRLSMDLRGIPPSPEEVKRFVADRHPQAYEKWVDTFLNESSFGERMAVHWLDLVRYADTVGYHGDNEFSVWPYRDYVINAFNSNMPYDQFTREQLAGDLIPNATQAQKVASGYNRLIRISTEGGIQDKEYRAKYASDRVRTTSTVWMGVTLGCAECHDHKFDPLLTKDFYQMQAYFADLNEKGFYDGGFARGDWGPKMLLTTPQQEGHIKELDVRMSAIRKQIDAVSNDALAVPRQAWIEATLRAPNAANIWSTVPPAQVLSSGGSELKVLPSHDVLVHGTNPAHDRYEITLPVSQQRISAVRLEVLNDESLSGNSVARSGVGFYLSEVEMAVNRLGETRFVPIALDTASASVAAEGLPAISVLDGDRKTSWGSQAGALSIRLARPLNGSEIGFVKLTLHHSPDYPRQHIGKFRISFTDSPYPAAAAGVPDKVLAAMKVAAKDRKPEEEKLLVDHYRGLSAELQPLRDSLAKLEGEKGRMIASIPAMLVSEKTTPRPIRILPRGDWMNDSGEVITPGIPAIFSRGDHTNQGSRLDLAEWLTSPENPLTSRTFVNRMWKVYFGTGLSRTLDDLGSQGEWPTHPELLDWLAVEFRDSGWDMKHLIKLLVTSATYRQSSIPSHEAAEKDPMNRLYSHQSRFRLDAEFVRDTALQASGLLVTQIGGPSARPYQPEGYYAPLNFPKREYAPDVGRGLYRRTVYTHWQRSFLHPSLAAFDAPSREECTALRINSNTPLQALVLLNDPIYVEAARVLGSQVASLSRSTSGKIRWAFERVVSRAPSREEELLLTALYQKELQRFLQDPEAARALIQVGESPIPKKGRIPQQAAWASVSRALLNLHETITRN